MSHRQDILQDAMSISEKLIQVVKKYPILYDIGHPDYKNIRKRDKFWGYVGAELNETVEQAKKKWKNLRDSYAKYLKSVNGLSTKKSYKNWQWASQMEPFQPFLGFPKTESHMTDPVYNNESLDETIENTYETKPLTDYPLHFLDTGTENNYEQLQTKQFENNNEEKYEIRAKASKSSTSSSSNAVLWESGYASKRSSMETELDYLNNKNRKTELTPTDMIFLGYSQILQTFSPRRQAQTKMKIAEIMTEQECLHHEQLARNNRGSSVHSSHTSRPPSSLTLQENSCSESTSINFAGMTSPERSSDH